MLEIFFPLKARVSTFTWSDNNPLFATIRRSKVPSVRTTDVFSSRFCYRYDFFLVSQSVRQGTVNPTHYNVISDTSGLKPDHIQRLTYKLTHLYYNWPVSYVRPFSELPQMLRISFIKSDYFVSCTDIPMLIFYISGTF